MFFFYFAVLRVLIPSYDLSVFDGSVYSLLCFAFAYFLKTPSLSLNATIYLSFYSNYFLSYSSWEVNLLFYDCKNTIFFPSFYAFAFKI